MTGPARVRLYAAKQFAGSTASFGGGLLVSFLFRSGGPGFPYNYGINLAVGFVGLGIATAGFYRIREPASPPPARGPETLSAYLRGVPALLRQDARFRRFLLVENLTSFSVMALPFYMVFAREDSDWIRNISGNICLCRWPARFCPIWYGDVSRAGAVQRRSSGPASCWGR